MRTVLLALMAAIAANGFAQDKAPEKKPEHTLWAAISTNCPVYQRPVDPKQHDVFTLFFGLVNDGKVTVDPKIGESHLLINGVEPKDWDISINNGPRSANFEALPPGESLELGMAAESFFPKPGIYKVVWKGKNFESPVITLRVLPPER